MKHSEPGSMYGAGRGWLARLTALLLVAMTSAAMAAHTVSIAVDDLTMAQQGIVPGNRGTAIYRIAVTVSGENKDGTISNFSRDGFRFSYGSEGIRTAELSNSSRSVESVKLYYTGETNYFTRNGDDGLLCSVTHVGENTSEGYRANTTDKTNYEHRIIYKEGQNNYCKISAESTTLSGSFEVKQYPFRNHNSSVAKTYYYWLVIAMKPYEQYVMPGEIYQAKDDRAGFRYYFTELLYVRSRTTGTNPTETSGDQRGSRLFETNLIRTEGYVVDMIAHRSDGSAFASSYAEAPEEAAPDITGSLLNEGYPAAAASEYLNSSITKFTSNLWKNGQLVGSPEVLDEDRILANPSAATDPVGAIQRELMGLHDPYPVLGFNLSGKSGSYNGPESVRNYEYIHKVRVQILVYENRSSFNPNTDLVKALGMTDEKRGAISLWRDANQNGAFEFDQDTVISLKYTGMGMFNEWEDKGTDGTVRTWETELEVDKADYHGSNHRLEDTADGLVDFFLCLCTEPSTSTSTTQPKYGSEFKVVLPKGGITFLEAVYVKNLNHNAIVKEDTKWAQIGFDVKPHIPDPLEADGFPSPVLMFNMASSRSDSVNESLHSIKIRFEGADFTPDDLAPLTDNETSGISIWQDNKEGSPSAMTVGVFDPRAGTNTMMIGDKCVQLSTDSLVWYKGTDNSRWDGNPDPNNRYYVILKPKAAIKVYDHDFMSDPASAANWESSSKYATGIYRGMDYFICIRGGGNGKSYADGSRGLDYGDTFKVSVEPSQDFLFGAGETAVEDASDGVIWSAAVRPVMVENDSAYAGGKRFSHYRVEPSIRGVKGISKDQVGAPTTKGWGGKYAVTAEIFATMPTFFSEPAGMSRELTANTKTAVLGIDVVAPNDGKAYTFNHFAFQIIDKNGTFSLSDFVDTSSTGTTSGIALYKDSNGDGFFDPDIDERISFKIVDGKEMLPKMNTMTWSDVNTYMIELELETDSAKGGVGNLPTDNVGPNAGIDYFLVMQPTKEADSGDSFEILLWGSDLLGTRDDTITYGVIDGGAFKKCNPAITYKRFRSTSEFVVTTVTNDILSNAIERGTVVEPATEEQLKAGTDTSINAIGIAVNDALGKATMNGFRVYFDSELNLDPSWVLNPINNQATDGIQIVNAAGKRLAVKSAKWVCETSSAIVYKGKAAPETIELTTALTKIDFSTTFNGYKVVWYDKDDNGIWSEGDSMWKVLATAATHDHVNMDKFSATADRMVLLGDPAEGVLGNIITTDNFGFTFFGNKDDANGLDPNNDSDALVIFNTGAGRTKLSYYIDIELESPAVLPQNYTGTPAFYIKARVQDDPHIFGMLQFNLSLLANGINYSTGRSYASSNITTELITYKSIPGLVSNLRVTREPGTFKLTWNVPAGNYGNVVIVRAVRDTADGAATDIFPGYPVNETFYTVNEDGQIKKYKSSGTAGNPEEGFFKDGDFYKPTDETADGVKIVYIGKGNPEEAGVRSFTDVNNLEAGKYYYYIAYAAAVTNTSEQGTPNSTFPENSQTMVSAQKARDQIIEASPWGVQCIVDVSTLDRPENVTGLTVVADGAKLALEWTNPEHYVLDETKEVAQEDLLVYVLRSTREREAAALEGLLEDGKEYFAEDKFLNGDYQLIAIIQKGEEAAVPNTYVDNTIVAGVTYYYALFAGDKKQMTYTRIPASAKGSIAAEEDDDEEVIVDANGNGIEDEWENRYFGGLIPANQVLADPDGDGLNNLYEYFSGTDPNNAYTNYPTKDSDADADGDGLTNLSEQNWGTRPDIRDSDDDGVADNIEVNQDRTHPAFSMAHINQNIIDLEMDGEHQKLTPELSLDMGVVASSATNWKGIELPENSRFQNLGNGATLETWLRLPETVTTGARVMNVMSGIYTVLGMGYEVDGGNVYVYADYKSIDGTVTKVGGKEVINARITAGEWVHVAAVWDPSNTSISVIINGVTELSLVTNYVPYIDETKELNVILGGDGVSSDNSMKEGLLDETRVWRGARSASAIKSVMDTLIPAASNSSLLAYYRYDDGGKNIEDFCHAYPALDAAKYQIKASDYSVVDANMDRTNAAKDGIERVSGMDGNSDWVTAVNAKSINGSDDADGDDLPDWWEAFYNNGNHANTTSLGRNDDGDADGLTNLYEYYCRTNPNGVDTNGDGVADGKEDFDGDGLTNAEEQRYSADPRLEDSDDDGESDKDEILAGHSPNHPSSRSNAARSSLDLAGAAMAEGIELPNASRFIMGNRDWTVETWFKMGTDKDGDIFTFESLAGDSIALSVENGYPVGMIYNNTTDGSGNVTRNPVIKNGGEKATGAAGWVMPELGAAWNHLALVWRFESQALTLYVNGVAMLSQHTSAELNIAAGDAFLGKGLTDGFIDEFRFWKEARSIEEIERWQYNVIPTHATINTSFNAQIFSQIASNEAVQAPPSPFIIPSLYNFSDVLTAYYRFDDKGDFAEDYVHFKDKDYYVDINKAFADGEFAKIDGIDDEDGDGLPEWWVELKQIDGWRKMDFTRTMGDDVYNVAANNTQGVNGTDTRGWAASPNPFNYSASANEPAEASRPQLASGFGNIIRDFTVYGSIGGLGVASSEDYQMVPVGSAVLYPSGVYTRLWKYIVLDKKPDVAPFELRVVSGTVNSLTVNGQTVAGATAGATVDIARYLKQGRNQIHLYLTSNTSNMNVTIRRPGFWTQTVGTGQTATTERRAWSALTTTIPLATMKADFQLTVDGKVVICRGDQYKFDPRSVWHGRTATSSGSLNTADLNDMMVGSQDYGIHNDPDVPMPGSEAFSTGDGLTNLMEYKVGTNPFMADSNNNGVSDAQEDFDGDGLSNGEEDKRSTDPTVADTDDDGMNDNEEVAQGYVPTDGNSPSKQRAVAFDGKGGYMLYPTQNRFALNSWSIEVWAKPATAPTNGADPAILLERSLGYYETAAGEQKKLVNYGIRIETDMKVTAYFTDIAGEEVVATSKDVLSADGKSWTHIAASYDASTSTITLWLNGAEARKLTASKTPVNAGPGLVLVKSGENYVGSLDEVRFWSDVRTADEINDWKSVTLVEEGNEALLANNPDALDNLVAYYRFDDGGETAQDSIVASFSDWNNSWRNAAVFVEGTTAPAWEDIENDSPIASDEKDTDGDGIPDVWEIKYGLDPEDASDALEDADGDGLNNLYEYLAGTDPTNMYTEGIVDIDGNAKDPDVLDSEWDADLDGLTNGKEQELSCNPMDPDSDDDGVIDGDEYTAKTSPLHSMNKLNGSDNFVNYSLDLSKIALGKETGLVIPVTAEEYSALVPEWTIEAWVKAAAPAEANGSIIRRMVSTRIGFDLGLEAGFPYVKYETVRGTEQKIAFPVAIAANEWIHLAATWNSTSRTLALYVNGSSCFSKEFAVADTDYLPVDGTSVYTMALPADTAAGWNGGVLLDNVRIWTACRTAVEIDAAKDELVQNNLSTLFRDFRFDDGGISIEDFAHPGWKNASKYTITALRYGVTLTDGTADWCNTDAKAFYGMDDSNNNGMPDWFETVYGISSADDDEDGDGLANLYEYLAGTDPTDTLNGTADFYALSSDGELTNGEKQYFGLDPRLADSDGDGLSDYDEVYGSDETLKRADEESFASDPLNLLAAGKPAHKYLVFNGTELTVGARAEHALESWTVMAMVKLSALAESTIISRAVAENIYNYKLALVDGGQKLQASFNDAESGKEFAVSVPTDKLLALDTWTHIAASYSKETRTLTLYVDGMPVAEDIDEKDEFDCAVFGTGIFGGEFKGAQFAIGTGFTGAMDNIRVYGGALTADKLAREYRTVVSADEGIAEPYGISEAGYFSMTMTASQLLNGEHVPNQLIVKFKDDVTDDEINLMNTYAGVKILKVNRLTGSMLVEVEDGTEVDMEYAINDYRLDGSCIDYVQPNYVLEISVEPNDQYYDELWGMRNMDVQKLWDKGIVGSKDVVVAVIDTGIDMQHADLQANMWVNLGEIAGNGIDDDGNGYVDDVYGYDMANDDSDPSDGNGHGTHCAGTIGAVGNNGIGVVGVNWNVKLMALKSGRDDGSLYSFDIIEAISYAVANGAHVANCSYGGYIYNDAEYDAMRKALDYGLLFAVAAGNESNNNDGVTPAYPASYDLDNILTVAAIDENNDLAYFSNYGATSVDVGAPGVSILSTVPGSALDSYQGTSMAAPHVAGLAALLKSAYPNASALDLKEAILNGTVATPAMEGKVLTGGRINAELAFNELSAGSLVLCLRGNGLVDGTLFDLTKSELGSGVAGINGKAPEAGRYTLDGSSLTAEATSFADSKYFLGDTDGDGIADWLEVSLGLDPATSDGAQDFDGDGLSNYFEAMAGTSPWNPVSDGKTLDSEIVNEALGLSYFFMQKKGYHPLTGSGDYAEYDQDDDGNVDKNTAEKNASNPLEPYKSRVLELKAGGFVTVPNQPRFAFAGGWAVDAWIMVPAAETAVSGEIRTVVRREIDTDADGTYECINYELGIVGTESGWVPFVQFTSRNINTEEPVKHVVRLSNVINADEWTHIGGTYDPHAKTLTIGMNNKDFRSMTVAGVFPIASEAGISRVTLGAKTNGFVGQIDAVRFWNIAKANFADYLNSTTSTLPATPTLSQGLVAYYIFDDGGESIQDFASALDDWTIGWFNAAVCANENATVIEGESPVTPADKDTDGDGMPDWWEEKYGLNPEDPSDANRDRDRDGLSNYYEYLSGTEPNVKDTDGNGITDDKEDADGDGLNNLEEQGWNSRPDLVDTDDDGINDKIEVVAGSSPNHPMSVAIWSDGAKLTAAKLEELNGASFTSDNQYKELLSNGVDDIEQFDFAQAPATVLDLGQLPTGGYNLPMSDRFAVGKGEFTVEMWVKAEAVPTAKTRLFTVVGETGYAYFLGLDEDGSPVGKIYSVDAASTDEDAETLAVAVAGGIGKTPALEAGTWTHLALVWDPAAKSLVLYRDRLAIVGSAQVSNADIIDFGRATVKANLNKIDSVLVDEFRVWSEARSEEQIDYWANCIVPAPIRPTLHTADMIVNYKLIANYRFDDGGESVEDFAHFRDADYMLNLSADAFVTDDAKSLNGTDDVDGDGIPEWWVEFHKLDMFQRESLDHHVSYRQREVWKSDGSHAGYSGYVQNVGTTPFGSGVRFVGLEGIGEYAPINEVLDGDYLFVSMHKYISLNTKPVKAMLNLENHNARVMSITVNQRAVGTANSQDIAEYLKVGRNQIVIKYLRTLRSTITYKVGDKECKYYSYSGTLDVELVCDDNTKPIVYGQYNPYDPRAVWYFRACTEYQKVQTNTGTVAAWSMGSDWGVDDNGYVLENADYGMMHDADGDGLDCYWEYKLGYNPNASTTKGIHEASADKDGDSLSNVWEIERGLDPTSKDTDNDGVLDNEEYGQGSDPLDFNDPIANRSIYFDGTDAAYVTLPSQKRFKLSSWTLEAWVKPETTDGYILTRTIGTLPGNTRTIGTLPGNTLVNYRLGMKGGQLFGEFTSLNGTTQTLTVTDASKVLATGVWSHVAMTFDGSSKLELFVNGINVASGNATVQPASVGPGIVSVLLGGGSFKGNIDEIRVWNVVRDAAGITETMTTTLFGDEEGLVAYYRFDDVDIEARTAAGSLFVRTAADSLLANANDWLNGWISAAVLSEGAQVYLDVDSPLENDADTNGNLIPDRWERKYFGRLLTNEAITNDDGTTSWFNEALLDYVEAIDEFTGETITVGDGDELNVLYEYYSNTNPLVSMTDGINNDGECDRDGDGVPNLEEQYNNTRPDIVDTDDDGFSDAFEGGYDYYIGGIAQPGVGYEYGASGDSSLSQPYYEEDGLRKRVEENGTDDLPNTFALLNEYSRVFRMDGTNNMIVADNGDHSSNTMTIAFWFRPGMTNGDTTIAEFGTPVTLLRRTVDSQKGRNNYMFTFDGKELGFAVGKKGSSVNFNKAVYAPAEGFASGEWYLVAGVVNVASTTTNKNLSLLVLKSRLTSTGDVEYVSVGPNAINISQNQGSNVGDAGDLIVGTLDGEIWPAEVVVDIDNLCIWNNVKTLADLRTMVKNNSTGYGEFANGLVSQFLFDDGGTSAEDFCYEQDWWLDWEHAGVMNVATEEGVRGMILDSTLAASDIDTDKDGLSDDWEIYFFKTLAYGPNDDPDEDGLTNINEYNLSAGFRDPSLGANPPFSTPLAWLDPNNADTDGDGMDDGFEQSYSSILNPLDPEDADSDDDEDGLANWEECLFGTDPTKLDTDGDGLPDGWEMSYTSKDKDGNIVDPSLNPLDATGAYGADGDPDGDNISNLDEYYFGTNPLVADSADADTDGDGIKDLAERQQGVNTDSALTDTDDDEFDDYTELNSGSRGYDSLSKPSREGSRSSFVYKGNLVGQINAKYGTMTVPSAGNDERLGFGSWTVEARFRVRDMDLENWTNEDYDVYLVRHSFSDTLYAENESVEDATAWNYAIGYRVKASDATGEKKIYPFVSFKSKNGGNTRRDFDDGLAIESINGKGTSEWHFLTGVYDSTKHQLQMYLNGDLISGKVYDLQSADDQCPINAKQAGVAYAYVKIGENFNNGIEDDSRLLVDEIRVWGVKPNTVAVHSSATGYLTSFVRSATEIADGHTRAITPTYGVYDPCIDDRYNTTRNDAIVAPNTHNFRIDTHVSDGEWTTKPGTLCYGSKSVFVCYHDANANGRWDPGEDIWRDRTLAEYKSEEGTADEEGEEEEELEEPEKYFYDEDVDLKLAWGTDRWTAGVAYKRTVVDAAGKTTTVDVTAEQACVGKELEVFFNDKNGNGLIDNEDDIWLEFDTNYADTWYQPSITRWAERMGLAMYIRFDDGGATIEDYVHTADWRSSPGWKHAIRPTGLAGNFPPKVPTAVGGVDYQFTTQPFADGFAWVINAFESPSTPVIEIATLSNKDLDGDSVIDAIIPTTESDINAYDVLSAKVTTQSMDPEGSVITYQYYWLSDVASAADQTKFDYVDGELLFDNTELESGWLLATGKELDLYNFRDIIASGDVLTVAVVANSESGMSSKVVFATITVRTDDDGLLKPVSFSNWNAIPAVPGQVITLTLKNNEGVTGDIVIRWYRNLNAFSEETKAVSANGTVTFSIPGDYVVDGDVWGYKAYFMTGESRSRTTPPESATGNDWIYLPVGIGYDEETEMTSNKPPTTPASVKITPKNADINSLLIAMADGSTDPDGDKFAYEYQWYQNGALVVGETFPFFPAVTSAATITNDDGTTTSLTATTLAAGDVITVRVWATDIHGNSSNKLVSNSVIILEDLVDANADVVGTIGAYEDNDSFEDATRLLPKTNWMDIDDENVQQHYFKSAYDFDYFWFIVPDKLSDNKTLVRFETNFDTMFTSSHKAEHDATVVDTKLDLFKSDNLKKPIHSCDNYYEGNASTLYARFELELEPGLYYVRVYRARSTSEYDSNFGYLVHLGLFDVEGAEGPTTATSVVLEPSDPTAKQDLICTADGAVVSEGDGEPEYYYVWYRNGVVVPFGKPAEVSSWNTARYTLSNAMNFSDDPALAAEPFKVPAEYTKPGDIWWCVVYAKDMNGYSEGVQSNSVTISGAYWQMNLNVTKTYRSAQVGSVTGSDQMVTIGLDDDATFGFDPSFDSAAATRYLPGTTEEDTTPLPLGTMYSVGMDNIYSKLNKDFRPYGRSSSWYIKIEMGDSSIDQCTLSWSEVRMPTDAVGGLTITRMTQLTDRTWEPVADTSIDMTSRNSITLNEEDLANAQKDANGQYFVVYRITLGAADEAQTLNLVKGWNMISFAVTPLNNNVKDVFSVSGKRLVKGDVWRYDGGQYVTTSQVVAGTGYWVYANEAGTVTVMGNRPTDGLSLKQGWNLVGPIYNVDNAKTTYGPAGENLYGAGRPIQQIYKSLSDTAGNIQYKDISGYGYKLSVGSAYWIYCTEDVMLPVFPTLD